MCWAACEQNIQNYHAPDAEGHDVIEDASETMIDVAMRINEIKRQHERWLRAQEVHNALTLTGDQRVDVVELGDLVLEVHLTVISVYFRHISWHISMSSLCFRGRLKTHLFHTSFPP